MQVAAHGMLARSDGTYFDGVWKATDSDFASLSKWLEKWSWARPAADVAEVVYYTFNRSEEHTYELQSPCNLVCRLLLEKKKKKRRCIAHLKNPLSHPIPYLAQRQDCQHALHMLSTDTSGPPRADDQSTLWVPL